MRYSGVVAWEASAERYMVPDDGMQQLLDCDIWMVLSDHLAHPVLPLRPMVLMVGGYLQRYQDAQPKGGDLPWLLAARCAQKVLVTTEFAQQDALQYAGIEPRKISKLPMLLPALHPQRVALQRRDDTRPYFIWNTNAGPLENHGCAVQALRIYYEELDGQWDCRLTGMEAKDMHASKLPHLKAMARILEGSKALDKRLAWMGELPSVRYQVWLAGASFLWHTARMGKDAPAVIEAACLGVPALCSDSPMMREIDTQFSLHLDWMNPDSPEHMAAQLKQLELEAGERKCNLPAALQSHAQRAERHAKAYWQELRTCL